MGKKKTRGMNIPEKSVLIEYTDLCALVAETEEDLRRLRREHSGITVDMVRGSNPNFPYEPRSFRIEGVSYSEYKSDSRLIRETEKLLEERRKMCMDKRLEVDYWMNTIPVRVARIIRAKYFQHLTWTEVAMRLGYESGDAARITLSRYMAKLSENS